MKTSITSKFVQYQEVRPASGAYVKPDGWRFGALLGDFEPGVLGIVSQALTFVRGVESMLPLSAIEVTGRTLQHEFDGAKVRVKLSFYGEDGELPTSVRGWLYLR